MLAVRSCCIRKIMRQLSIDVEVKVHWREPFDGAQDAEFRVLLSCLGGDPSEQSYASLATHQPLSQRPLHRGRLHGVDSGLELAEVDPVVPVGPQLIAHNQSVAGRNAAVLSNPIHRRRLHIDA